MFWIGLAAGGIVGGVGGWLAGWKAGLEDAEPPHVNDLRRAARDPGALRREPGSERNC